MKINPASFYSSLIKGALKNDPPGEWMSTLPANCIRLSSGYPDPALIPVEELQEATKALLDEERDLPLHYLGSPQMEKLKKHIAERLAKRGIVNSQEELLVTAGACQAIDLIARVLMDEQTVVLVEAPTYMEALEIFQNYTKQIVSIPVDENGMDTEKLEVLLSQRQAAGMVMPTVLYTIPTFQNPTGTTLTEKRRQHLLQLASRYNFLIIEDDAYGELAFQKAPQPLKAADHDGRVLHIGSFSKIVAPGLRVGWVAAQEEFISALFWFKKDLEHPFAEATMSMLLDSVDLDERLKTLRATYERKHNTLIAALQEHVPSSVSWYVPNGGYFIWVRIPNRDTEQMLEKALLQGVSYIPGKYFFYDKEKGNEWLRLSFSYEKDEAIVEGIKKLGRVINNR